MDESTFFEPPRTLVIKLAGEMTTPQAQEIYANLVSCSKGTDTLDLLIDFSNFKGIPPSTRGALTKMPHEVICRKVASYGASASVRVLVSLMVKILPHIRKSKFFKTEQEAREWLANDAR